MICALELVSWQKREFILDQFGSLEVASMLVQQKKLYIIKIFYHKVTKAHQNAVRILELAKSDHLPKLVEKSKSQYFRTTSRLMRTAYSVAKCNRPLVAFQELCELQEANGLNQGIGLHSSIVERI